LKIPKSMNNFKGDVKQSEAREPRLWHLYFVTDHNPKEEYSHGAPVPEFCGVAGPNIPDELGMVPVEPTACWLERFQISS